MKETTAIGELEFSGNELKVDATIEDAPKLRQGVYDPHQHAIACFSGDRLDHNLPGRRAEKVLLMFKHEPSIGGYYRFCAEVPNGNGSDTDMKTLLDVRPDGIVAYVPIRQASGPSEPPTAIWPAIAPVARDGSGGGASFISIYQGYMSNDLHHAASAAQKALVQTYVDKYGYIDNAAYNWIMGTFVYSGLVQ